MSKHFAGEIRAFLNKLDEMANELENTSVNEEKVKIITYNSGHGQQLDAIVKNPEHHREVEVVQLRIGHNGAPELVFKDEGGNSVAQWNQKYGWVADYD